MGASSDKMIVDPLGIHGYSIGETPEHSAAIF